MSEQINVYKNDIVPRLLELEHVYITVGESQFQQGSATPRVYKIVNKKTGVTEMESNQGLGTYLEAFHIDKDLAVLADAVKKAEGDAEKLQTLLEENAKNKQTAAFTDLLGSAMLVEADKEDGGEGGPVLN